MRLTSSSGARCAGAPGKEFEKARERKELSNPVADLIFIAATILLFLLALAYVRGCEKL